MNAVVEQIGTDATTVRSFRVDVPEEELTELKRRIMNALLADEHGRVFLSPLPREYVRFSLP